MKNLYDMRGFDPENKQVNPEILSPNQRSVYDTLANPKTTAELYFLYKGIMPESSVRRILYTLKYKGLAEKTNNVHKKQEWEAISYDA